jgi:peptidoglycan/LPS O-acetylase OafA/YrhL
MITYVVMNKGKSRFSFSAFLNNKVLFFLGKISYGIYLYHLPLVWFALTLSPLINKYLPFHFVKQHHTYVLLLVEACLLILISWLSWKFIEKPTLRLKKYFDYQPSLGKIKGEELSTQKLLPQNP